MDGSSPLRVAGGRSLIEEVLEQRAAYLIGVIANRLVNAGSALCRRHAQIGFPDRNGGGSGSWNSAHGTRGCAQVDLPKTHGIGLFYCFAIN